MLAILELNKNFDLNNPVEPFIVEKQINMADVENQ